MLYFPVEQQTVYKFATLSDADTQYMEQCYFAIKPDGEIKSGLEGFQWWALKTQQHKNFKAFKVCREISLV